MVIPEGGEAPTIGDVSVVGTFVARADAPRQEDAEKVRGFIKDLDGTYADFLAEAQAKGLDESAAGGAVVAAWNEGVLPRVARTVEYRSGTYPIYFLHGHVPEDLFSYMEEEFEEPGIQYGGKPGGGVVVEGLEQLYPSEPNPDDANAFYVERFNLPVTTGNREIHRDFIGSIVERAYAQFPQSSAQPPQPN